jgi:hypothetical protein
VGFLLISGRSTPESAVHDYIAALNDRDAQATHDLLCRRVAGQVSTSDISAAFGQVPGNGPIVLDVHVGDASDAVQDGLEGKTVPLTGSILGESFSQDVFLVDESGWKLCSNDLTF